jgi:nucleoside-diphosphate-sugar epimerase
MVFLSSASVHGQAPPEGTDELSRLSAKQDVAYNNAKVQAEQILRRERSKGQTEIVLLRPSIVWGPRSRWVGDFATAVLQGSAYVVNGANGVCNSVYVDNLLQAIELALEKPGIDGEAFFVQDREAITWRNFYTPLIEALGSSWADVADVPPPPSVRRSMLDRVHSLRASAPVQALLPRIPGKLKRIAKASLAAWPEPPASDNWRLPQPATPALSHEMALLHQCSYRLPDDKAKKLLGYDAVVSFEEAMARSIGWLEFAGYPTKVAHGG